MNKATKIVLICILLCVAVYIGVFIGRSSIGDHVFTSSDSQTDGKNADGKININTASAEELEQIPGITPKIANSIIQYRREYGKFITLLELVEVDGISRSLYDSIKIYITIGS